MDVPGDVGRDGQPRQDSYGLEDRGVMNSRGQGQDDVAGRTHIREEVRRRFHILRTGFKRAPDPDPDEPFRDLYYHVDPAWVKCLENRHLQMIALGGAIGTGLFIGTGRALHDGGPLSLIFGFLYIGVDLIFTVYALGEMSVMFPVSGGFVTFSSRFINDAWGFAVGWK